MGKDRTKDKKVCDKGLKTDRALHHRRPWRRHPSQKCAQILKGAGARGGDGGERSKQL